MPKSKLFPPGRPLAVTFMSIFVLCITAWNGIRVWAAISAWNTLARFNGAPAYLLGSGLVWFITGLVLSFSLLTGKRFAWGAMLILSVIYMIWYWVDRLALQASPAANSAFSAAVSLIVFAVITAILFWPSSRTFFTRRSHE